MEAFPARSFRFIPVVRHTYGVLEFLPFSAHRRRKVSRLLESIPGDRSGPTWCLWIFRAKRLISTLPRLSRRGSIHSSGGQVMPINFHVVLVSDSFGEWRTPSVFLLDPRQDYLIAGECFFWSESFRIDFMRSVRQRIAEGDMRGHFNTFEFIAYDGHESYALFLSEVFTAFCQDKLVPSAN